LHAVLIENPQAGQVTPASLKVAERALEATFDLELVRTNARGHAAALAREAVEAGAKTVVAFGGDGTVNEIINGLLDGRTESDVVLAVLPGGTTNVLARNLGFPQDLVEATAQLMQLVEGGEPRRLGLGRITAEGEVGHIQRDFAFSAGLVLDAEIVRRVNQSKRGRSDSIFLWQGLRTFLKLRKAFGPELVIDTENGKEQAYWACIANADPFTYYRKRPLRLAPGAGRKQGLDLVAAKQVRFWTTLRWLTQTLGSGGHVRHKDCLHLTDQNEVRITARHPVPLQTDGEYLGNVTTVTAVTLPFALPVWA
jgi:diacylglycerol kinase family enzyme